MTPEATPDLAECRRAIARVVEAIERHRDHTLTQLQRAIGRVTREAELARRVYQAQIQAALLTPHDPLELPWDPFARLGIMHREIYWTQWLGALLDPGSHPGLAALTLLALVDTVLARPEPAAHLGLQIMTRTDWRALATQFATLRVAAESSVAVLPSQANEQRIARPDIMLRTDHSLVVIEIKLEGWWNWEQRSLYEQLARQQAGKRKVGLIYLTGSGPDPQATHWCSVSWQALGQALRRRLRSPSITNEHHTKPLELMPALILIQAIERHRMGLPSIPPDGLGSLSLDDLARIAHHLTGSLAAPANTDDD